MSARSSAWLPATGPSQLSTPAAGNSTHAATAIRVLIADAQPLFRYGTREFLHTQTDCVVVGEAGSAQEALALARERTPTILLLDFLLPGSGVDVLEQLRDGDIRIVVVAASLTRRDVASVMKMRARGIIFRDAAPQLLLKCVRSVCAGELWLGRRELAQIMLSDRIAPMAVRAGLTRREREIIGLVATGESNRSLARLLAVSEDTIKHHLTNIFDKTGVSNRLELTLFAQRHHLLETD